MLERVEEITLFILFLIGEGGLGIKKFGARAFPLSHSQRGSNFLDWWGYEFRFIIIVHITMQCML